MKWTLNKVKSTLLVLAVVAFFFVAMAYQWIIMIAPSAICALALLYINLRYWRCADCGTWLGRGVPKYCPDCGKKLDYDMELPKK